TLNIIQYHPYQLVSDIFGIGFKKADQIAINSGIMPDDRERLVAGVMYTLNDEINSVGHTYIEVDTLKAKSLEILNTDKVYFSNEDIIIALETLADNKKIIISKDRVTLPSIYYAEHKSSEKLSNIINYKIDEIDEAQAKISLKKIEKSLSIQYSDKQSQAILNALTEKVSIITGGPGTGKTTIVKGIIALYKEMYDYKDFKEYEIGDYPIKLAAPTGRAAKRMADTSGIDARTIHRLIGWGQDTE